MCSTKAWWLFNWRLTFSTSTWLDFLQILGDEREPKDLLPQAERANRRSPENRCPKAKCLGESQSWQCKYPANLIDLSSPLLPPRYYLFNNSTSPGEVIVSLFHFPDVTHFRLLPLDLWLLNDYSHCSSIILTVCQSAWSHRVRRGFQRKTSILTIQSF